MSPAPTRQEVLETAVARAQLRAAGGIYRSGYSTAARHVYETRRPRAWVTLESVAGGRVRLSWFAGCPC